MLNIIEQSLGALTIAAYVNAIVFGFTCHQAHAFLCVVLLSAVPLLFVQLLSTKLKFLGPPILFSNDD